MNNELIEKMAAVRECWSQQETQSRAELAQAMQLQLRAIVVLSELARQRPDKQNEQFSVIANAC